MTQRFDEMAAQRDPLYAAMKPQGDFAAAVRFDRESYYLESPFGLQAVCDVALHNLAVRALRNQGQPYYYYTEEQP